MNLTTSLIGIGVAILMSVISVPLMIRLGRKYSLLDHPGKHKRHLTPTPILGGAALFVTTWVCVALGLSLNAEYFVELADSIVYIFSGALIITLVGLADDLAPISAWVKLGAQIAAGAVLFQGGLGVDFISTPYGSIDPGPFSIVITVGWVVILTNAINLIDGLDGLASGVSLIGALVLLVIGQLYNVGPGLVFITSMIGFLGVFLFFNLPPAKIFLGDSGSMQIGYYFAVFSLFFPLKSYTVSALYLPMLVLGVPILEAFSSFVRRLISGKNVMAADRRHLFHYLSLAGFSARQIVAIFYFMAIVFGLFALAMFFWDRLVVFGYLIFFMVVIFSLFFILLTNISPNRKNSGNGGNGNFRLFRSRLK